MLFAFTERRQGLLGLVAGIERQLVGHQGGGVGRLGHGEVGRQVAVEQARALELGEARQVLDGVEAEMVEELLRSCRR